MRYIIKYATLCSPFLSISANVFIWLIASNCLPEYSFIFLIAFALLGIAAWIYNIVAKRKKGSSSVAKYLMTLSVVTVMVLSSWHLYYGRYSFEKEQCDHLQNKTTYSYRISEESEYHTAGKTWKTKMSPVIDGKALDFYITVTSSYPINASVGDCIETELYFFPSSVSSFDSASGCLRYAYLSTYTESDVSHADALFFEKILTSSRNYVSGVLLRVSGKAYPLCKAIVLGDTSSMSSEMYNNMRGAGLLHVCAVSGLHVSFLSAMILSMLRLFRNNTFKHIILTIILFFLAALTGFSPSVVRASLLIVFTFGLRNNTKFIDRMNLLGLIFCIVAVLMPQKALGPSMLLSFAAMAGIYTVAIPMNDTIVQYVFNKTGKLLSKFTRSVIATVSMSFSCILFTLPISQFFFGSFSYMGVFSNIFCLEVIQIMFSISIISVLASVIPSSEALDGVWRTVLEYCNAFIEKVSGIFSGDPLSDIKFSWEMIIICIILIVALILLFAKKRRNKGSSHDIHPGDIVLCVVITAVILFALGFFRNNKDENTIIPSEENVRVVFVDVGQGMGSIVVRGDSAAIVDCGGSSNSGEAINKWLFANNIKKVDTLIISHLHDDHANGMKDIFDAWDLTEVIVPYTEGDAALFVDVMEYSAAEGATLTLLEQDTTRKVEDVELKLLTKHFDETAKDQNENSIVAIVSYGSFNAMLTGDITASSEKRLLSSYSASLLNCDVFGVPHHGSKYSSSDAFVAVVSPALSVISVGKNSYKHPNEGVITKLEQYGQVLTTQTRGTVEVITDGVNVNVATEK